MLWKRETDHLHRKQLGRQMTSEQQQCTPEGQYNNRQNVLKQNKYQPRMIYSTRCLSVMRNK